MLDVIRRAGATPVSVDPASAEFLREVGPEAFLAWTKGAAILFPNGDEAAVLTGAGDPETQCARLAAIYPLVVLKRGASGAVAAAGATRWRVAAPAIEVVDTTGAGDAFVAGFLLPGFSGDEIEMALDRAVAAGADASTRVGRPAQGANPSLRLMGSVTPADILAFAALYSYLCDQHGFRSKNCYVLSFPSRERRQYSGANDIVLTTWRHHVHSSRQARRPVAADHGGRRRPSAPRLRLRRHVRFRSVPDDGRFPRRRPADYQAGFPWHPHRGIETITYVLAGAVDHGDSLGNRGKLGAGDVQWMTAGSGIMHQEMPTGDALGRMHGFQLWANLPAKLKMTKPRYQDVPATAIPEVTDDDGTTVRVICGEFWGKTGPVDGVAAEPRYLDVTVPAGKRKRLKVEDFRQAFAYIFEGSADFSDASAPFGVLREAEVNGEDTLVRDRVGNRSLVVFGAGDEISVQAGEEGVRFLLVSGRPLREPIAWHGPIVMNTQDQIRQAMMDLRDGSFIRG